jgi:hypothetical protein
MSIYIEKKNSEYQKGPNWIYSELKNCFSVLPKYCFAIITTGKLSKMLQFMHYMKALAPMYNTR